MSRILLVDDDATMSALYKEVFEKEGFSFHTARDGEEGLKLALEILPDVILLDILLPKKDGMTVMHQLRATEWGKKEPIIILTNVDPDDTMLSDVIQGQPTYYLLKTNTTPEELLEKVKQILQEKH